MLKMLQKDSEDRVSALVKHAACAKCPNRFVQGAVIYLEVTTYYHSYVMLGKMSQKSHVSWFWEWRGICYSVRAERSIFARAEGVGAWKYMACCGLQRIRIGGWRDRSWKGQWSLACHEKFGTFNCEGWIILKSFEVEHNRNQFLF